MTDYPTDVSDGEVLEADTINSILAARTGDILPIDDTTRNYTDVAGAIGDVTRQFADANIDNLKLDGNTLSSVSGNINVTPLAGNSTVIGSSVIIDPDGNVATSGEISGLSGIFTAGVSALFVATDGGAELKRKEVNHNGGGSGTYSFAHGLGGSIRGVSNGYVTAATSVTDVYADGTNITYTVGAAATVYFIVDYV